jgi:hypothetical protein
LPHGAPSIESRCGRWDWTSASGASVSR